MSPWIPDFIPQPWMIEELEKMRREKERRLHDERPQITIEAPLPRLPGYESDEERRDLVY